MYVSASTALNTSAHCTHTQSGFVNTVPKGIVALDEALDQDLRELSFVLTWAYTAIARTV